jgi:hypothetical protein
MRPQEADTLPSASTKPSARQGTAATSRCVPLVPSGLRKMQLLRTAGTLLRATVRGVTCGFYRGVRFDPALRWPAWRAGSTVALKQSDSVAQG